ncbi:hypothetical protein FOMPIDRAFT_1059299 [Fomitopsis schrenkii]|uniref:Carboxylic ester hydrolase n=1 Tax=Fomitopsis schrenkii TaxID=2126942 RepID=S8ECC2_FOMSC|nr:hypothetical protein FOMPIDRAFT_1059299 [Fomitopsis schrenkii]
MVLANPRALLVAVALMSFPSATFCWSSPPNATTRNGTYVGRYNAEYDQDFFLGIPYAQPPVGDLRFANPQSLDSSFDGIRYATEYSAQCIGYGYDPWGVPPWDHNLSEDCLYLNVIRPANYSSYDEPLPVAVWLYGGGFWSGGTADQRYNLSFTVQNSVNIGKPFIGVSFNYRLSAWGLLASSALAEEGTSNMALRDERLALHWLQENIGAFGGDPAKVTLWGESAGAMSIGFHLVAYNGRDDKLFRGGIMESGNTVQCDPQWSAEHFDSQYQAIVDSANCTGVPDVLGCLRHAPFEVLNDAINTTTATAWRPVLDGDFLPDYGSKLLAAGKYVHVPIISGANDAEGTLFGPTGINTSEQFSAYLQEGSNSGTTSSTSGIIKFPELSADQAELVMKGYPDDPCEGVPSDLGCERLYDSHGLQFRRTSAYTGDAVFIANRRLQCQTWAASGTPAYCFRFNTRVSGRSLVDGPTHYDDIAFVFDNTHGYGYLASPNPFQDEPQSYYDLARLMSSSWASFIHDLDPNSFRLNDTVTPLWPVYSNDDPRDIVWDADVPGSAYVEPDTFRSEGIAIINSLNDVFLR